MGEGIAFPRGSEQWKAGSAPSRSAGACAGVHEVCMRTSRPTNARPHPTVERAELRQDLDLRRSDWCSDALFPVPLWPETSLQHARTDVLSTKSRAVSVQRGQAHLRLISAAASPGKDGGTPSRTARPLTMTKRVGAKFGQRLKPTHPPTLLLRTGAGTRDMRGCVGDANRLALPFRLRP